jgi:hypothetical protein
MIDDDNWKFSQEESTLMYLYLTIYIVGVRKITLAMARSALAIL